MGTERWHERDTQARVRHGGVADGGEAGVASAVGWRARAAAPSPLRPLRPLWPLQSPGRPPRRDGGGRGRGGGHRNRRGGRGGGPGGPAVGRSAVPGAAGSSPGAGWAYAPPTLIGHAVVANPPAASAPLALTAEDRKDCPKAAA